MHAGGNTFWIYDLLETVRRQGLEVVLTGQVGNGSISWSGGGPENYWPLLLTGRWRALQRKAKEDPSLSRAIRSHFLRPLVQPFRNQFARLRQAGRPPWADYAAINPAFARSLDLKRQMKAAGHDPFFIPPADPRQAQLQLVCLNSLAVGAAWAETGAAYGMEVRDPTMDKRLVEFCLAIPQEQYRLDGQNRALIRRAMLGLLPDEVRLNTRRGRQAADIGHRLLAELPQVQAILAQLEASELARTVLDLPKIQSVLSDLQTEVNRETTKQSVTILTRGLMAGMFLLRFEQP
jgi:asparagine synthase (glutamine-hydrolysing)